MKKVLILIFTFYTSIIYAGWDPIDGWGFYNLFKQTNISAEEFYPFLREDYATFYSDSYSYNEDRKKLYPKGNVALWKEILVNWNINDLEKAIYNPASFSWSNKNSEIEKRAKIYLEFAQMCSNKFNYRINKNSWDYNEIKQQEIVDTEYLLLRANELLVSEKNPQLKARYYYQIIRVLHYSFRWEEAINFYESKIESKIPKNEIYYYLIDQIAGCYYSTEDYEKAAYLFTTVLNKSIDRKRSAFISYNLCTLKNADGKPFFKGIEDEKNFLLIKSLRNFSNELNNINEFINLDANEERIELLFMRALNNAEREVWPKYIGVSNKTLPFYENKTKYKKLLLIADNQINNNKVQKKDFWKIASSYLSFMNQDLKIANSKLSLVKSFPKQKKALSIIYEVFNWNEISSNNENYIYSVLNTYPKQDDRHLDAQNDLRNFVLDKIAHTYYKNNKIAKAFLVHNYLEEVNNINSLELLNALEDFYYKTNKSDYEKLLIANMNEKHNFIDYINYQKGIYYLYDKNPELALIYFKKDNSYKTRESIPNTIFSNNIKECFTCDVTEIMGDEVYKADVFSFIKTNFSRKELATNLIELKKLTSNEKIGKAKLANYLLGNYYYNISNTGYYRGVLTNSSYWGDRIYMERANTYENIKYKTAPEIIVNKIGYNLKGIYNYETHYFGSSNEAMKYYQNVVGLSTDKELNARCTYLMAKCELNNFYNNGSNDTYKMMIDGSWNEYELELPHSKSFKLLKEKYSDTEFHKMIIKECGYYRYYSNHN